ncbi:MAG: lytic transglycosylase domain-containing protein [Clostridiaceae bacterium]
MNKVIFRITIFFLLAILITISIKPVGRIVFPIKYSEIINKYSSQYDIETYLVAAIIKTESNFKDTAKSEKNALGLMQITPETGKWIAQKHNINDFSEDMLLEEETNIKFGCWYLRDLYNEFNGNIDNVLAAYNGGRGNVNKWLKDQRYSSDGIELQEIPFKETDQYVKKVEFFYNVYKFLYEENK